MLTRGSSCEPGHLGPGRAGSRLWCLKGQAGSQSPGGCIPASARALCYLWALTTSSPWTLGCRSRHIRQEEREPLGCSRLPSPGPPQPGAALVGRPAGAAASWGGSRSAPCSAFSARAPGLLPGVPRTFSGPEPGSRGSRFPSLNSQLLEGKAA